MFSRSPGAGRLRTGLLAAAALSIVALIVTYPGETFEASLLGLTVWWDYVFPALLPFLILSEILLGFGAIHAFGTLMEPAMRLWFRLPGAGGWALALSFAAGFPGGAKAAADLRRQGLVTRAEGERLLMVSHLASPVFLAVVVAAGFAGKPELGLPLLIVHLVSALACGFIVGRLPYPGRSARPAAEARQPSLWKRTAHAMLEARRRDGRPFGRLLGDAAANAFQTLLVIGGLMIVFSVMLRLLGVAALSLAPDLLQLADPAPFGLPAELARGTIAALFEVHLGAYALVANGGVPQAWAAALVSAAVAWGGLSIHAQAAGFTGGTDLRYAPFLLGRILHALLAAAAALMLWDPLRRWFGEAVPAFLPSSAPAAPAIGAVRSVLLSIQSLSGFLLAVMLLSFALRIVSRLRAARK